MLAQSCKFGVNCCFIGLTHPAACTRARVPLTFGHVHRPPPLTQFAQKGVPIDWVCAEDSKCIIISGKCPSKILKGGSQQIEPPPPPPPSRPSPIGLIYIPIDSSQFQYSGYKIKKCVWCLIVDVQKLQGVAPPAYYIILYIILCGPRCTPFINHYRIILYIICVCSEWLRGHTRPK
jgi:hypothetical protein